MYAGCIILKFLILISRGIACFRYTCIPNLKQKYDMLEPDFVFFTIVGLATETTRIIWYVAFF